MNPTTHSVITVNPPPVSFTETFMPPTSYWVLLLTADIRKRKRGRPRIAFQNEIIVRMGRIPHWIKLRGGRFARIGPMLSVFTVIFFTSRETIVMVVDEVRNDSIQPKSKR